MPDESKSAEAEAKVSTAAAREAHAALTVEALAEACRDVCRHKFIPLKCGGRTRLFAKSILMLKIG